MKFFKFLLQILAMGLCFVAGMVYEKSLLQKTTTDVETNISIEKNVDSNISADEIPTEQQDVIDDEPDFNDNNDMLIDNTQIQNFNDGQQVQPVIPEQQTTQEQPIIINNVEVINSEPENNDNIIQQNQDEQLPNVMEDTNINNVNDITSTSNIK